MKKNSLSIVILAIVVCLSSCGSSSSFDSDVRKMANYECRAKQLAAKDPSDEKAKKELEDLNKEMEVYGEKMRDKYKDKKNDKDMEAKAEAIFKEIMDKCK